MYHKKDRENQRYNKVIIVVNIDDNTCSLKLIETKHKVLGLFYNYIFTKHCNKKKLWRFQRLCPCSVFNLVVSK